jgi:chitin binding protein
MKRLTLALLCLAAPASAHFKLIAPESRSQQDALGGPQKSEPCGLSDSSATADDTVPTNAVTTLMEGSMIDVKITETIFHPGHYRVSIAQDIASLPNDPTVTPGNGFACGSTAIDANPQLPLVADGLFVHTSSFSGSQTTKVQLPAGFTCDHCILQVVEFMGDHGLNNPGGCFYHHCAVVTISANAPDGGVQAGDDAGTGGGGSSGGCCSTGSSPYGNALVALLVVGGVLIRRRRQ